MSRRPFHLPESIAARLGKAPDYVLAKEAGCSPPVIARHRSELNIPPFAYAEMFDKATAEAKESTVVTTVRAAFQGARPGADGMVIPFDLFAKAAKDVL